MSDSRETSVFGRFVAAAAVAVVAGTTRAQVAQPEDNGPVIIGENQGKYVWWDLQRFSTNLEFYGQFNHYRLSVQGQPEQSVDFTQLRADTNISFESYIGHKNLIDLTCDLTIGYEDDQINSNLPAGDVHERQFLDLYNVQALILGEGPLPTTVYSRRDQTSVARDFSTTLRSDTTESGVIVSYLSEAATGRLQYFHREVTQTDDLTINDSSTQDTVNFQGVMRLSDQQRLELTYTFDHINESQGPTFQNTYNVNDGNLVHQYDFGDQRQNNLRSSAHIYDQTGEFQQTFGRIDEFLLLRHSDTLETRYNLSFNEQSYAGAEQQVINGYAQLRHKLFQSLISTFTVGGNHVDYPGQFQSSEVYILSQLDYTKKVPYGRLDVNLSMLFDHQVNGDRGTDVFVLDESHVVTDPTNIVLNRRNIVPSSIVMTNQTQTFVYQQGIDYTVEVFPDHVEIRRNPFGPNPPAIGQTVLIDYLVGPEPGNTIDTVTQNYSARYTVEQGFLTGLSAYVYYLETDYALTAAAPFLFIPDNVKDLRVGLEYHNGGLMLLAEHRNHNSTIQPYDENRYEALYAQRLTRDSALSVELRRDEINYNVTGAQIDLNLAIAQWNQRLSTDLDFSIYLQYRDSRDSIYGNVNGLEEAVQVHWQHGQTQLAVSFLNSTLNSNTSSALNQTVTVTFTRAF